MASLQAHKDDIKEKDYDKFQSVAKDLGKDLAKPRIYEKKEEEPENDADQVHEEEREIDDGNVPEIDQEVRDKVEVDFDQMKMALSIMKRELKENQREEIDSDEEVKQRELKQNNEKLLFINRADALQFKSCPVKGDLDLENALDRQELPIVFHEQQIMESLENNVVTIICGETGSGKSTQIPQFILNSHRANPWKFRIAGAEDSIGEGLLVGIT